jgi:hypothetical protein
MTDTGTGSSRYKSLIADIRLKTQMSKEILNVGS